MDPRASTPRDIEACRSPNCRKSAKSDGVPRAVFVGLLRSAPGGLTFQATILSFRIVGRLTTALGPGQGLRTCDRSSNPPSRGPSGARLVRRDVCGLDRRAVGLISAATSFPGHRSPPRI
jgi:hypothetical protein